ncbi:NAD-glutamate dehydrogenase [Iodobacter fluviatilis]|uniref:NAD-glutamate dehydrogenase n=1 Tax=Iodobacter fluviatilis TaxID=537 RepID=A0A7G3GCX4_9NEIS|nr:NAD-glutamate dehydrogenase [Iodobacter fluviatilis]QBC45327.1 NAD-glutamate dehydrogenase [Iodobacter fluviatilis]
MTVLSTLKALGELVAASDQPITQDFLSAYFAHISEDDLIEKTPEDWFGAVLAHWRMARNRVANTRKLRIYNPSVPDHGWQSSHTVIEIVQPDRPFLVDTIGMSVARLGYGVHQVVHPVLQVTRQENGDWQEMDEAGAAESWMHIEIDRITSSDAITQLENDLNNALDMLDACVTDWPAMADRVTTALEGLRHRPPPLDIVLVRETSSFLEWMLAGHFIFLGVRDYRFAENGDLHFVGGSGHGLLRDAGDSGLSHTWAALPVDLRERAYSADQLILMTKADTRSLIHRPAYLDMVSLREVDATGKVIGELRILGLYTASAYTSPPRNIPLLRKKINAVLLASDADVGGYRGKALLNVIDTYPRDELLEIGIDDLARIAQGVVSLHERSRVRTFFREDLYRRYVSVMLFVPRDNYTTEVRVKVEKILMERLGGYEAEFNVLLADSPLARIHFLIHLPVGERIVYDVKEIEDEIARAAQRWQDDLRNQLSHVRGEETGAALYQRYQRAFSPAYCADFTGRVAVYDIEALEASLKNDKIAITLSPGSVVDPTLWRLKLYRGKPIELSDCLPLLENLGVRVLDERPYALTFDQTEHAWIIDIGLRLPTGTSLENSIDRERLIAAFTAIFEGACENDSFNRLILGAGLAWREVLILRAYACYMRQVNLKYGIEIIADCLLRHGKLSGQLAALFVLAHDPVSNSAGVAEILAEEIRQACANQSSVDEEKILSSLLAAILATVRTNFFQLDNDGKIKSYMSFKVESARIPNMPQPVPLFEIFVYSPEMEGVHLRGGKVARGGLRWSDRREDFRTEVLGLVKAQMVKNTVIVPVGSKGGFVVKNPPSDREMLMARGIECYKNFIRGLLDLTDNLVAGQVVHPSQVRRLDEDDPYLVVAADKGTATFSDIANGISRDYGFWLDDAFASGGSVGYDHKKMGITAKGAWVSVERQFRELGINTRTDEFTVIGVGDMSGDVFGNGLLRSEHTKLLGAFDHRHIFLDPNPDPAASFKERARLFDLPRSSWADYSAELISAGGGIWPRNAKTIPLSAEVKAILDIEDDELEPSELIRAMLKAPVDLFYNGGIGTYGKASTQTPAEANDRGTDALRIDGKEFRCKVIAEGGNLGFTQLGRIEYAANGGRVHTDAIDNSAGVDCSDHEVNIKILLGRIMAGGDLTMKQRNDLLASMTDEVGHLVLRDNYLQTEAISLEYQQTASLLPVHQRFMQSLEKNGRLSRRIEFLPTDTQIAVRQQEGKGLERPELAVLLAYAKMALFQDLLASDLPDSLDWDGLLAAYFPKPLVDRFGDRLGEHPLRREIVANELTNRTINRMGISFVFRLSEETELPPATIVRAWYDATELLDSEARFVAIESLDNSIPATMQYTMLLRERRQLEHATRWLLQNQDTLPDYAELIRDLKSKIPALLPQLPEWYAGSAKQVDVTQSWLAAGVPAALAKQSACLDGATQLLNIALLTKKQAADVDTVATIHFALGDALELDWLHGLIEQLPRANHWQTLARLACRDDLQRAHIALTSAALDLSPGAAPSVRVESWLQSQETAIAHCRRMFEEMKTLAPDLAMMSAALREIRHRLAV